MNINQAINGVVERIQTGETVRVKQDYKEEVISRLTFDYIILQEDEQYFYIKRNTIMEPITIEDLQNSVFDTNGEPISSDQGMVVGYNSLGQEIRDIHDTRCLAYKVIYNNMSKNEYYVALDRERRLYDPTDNMNSERFGVTSCTAHQFDIYLEFLRTRVKVFYNQLRADLKTN